MASAVRVNGQLTNWFESGRKIKMMCRCDRYSVVYHFTTVDHLKID